MRKLFTQWLFAAFILGCGTLSAQTWTGGAGNGNWNDAGNWDTGIPAGGAGETIIFNNSVQSSTTNNLPTTTRHRITIASGSSARTFGGSTANTFSNDGAAIARILSQNTGGNTINFPIEIADNSVLELQTTAGSLTINGTITGGGTAVLRLNVAAGTSITLNGAVSGGLKVEVSGGATGDVVFTPGNALFSGNLEIAGGRVSIRTSTTEFSVFNMNANEVQVNAGALTVIAQSGTFNNLANPATDNRPKLTMKRLTGAAGVSITVNRCQLEVIDYYKKGSGGSGGSIMGFTNNGVFRLRSGSTLEYTGPANMNTGVQEWGESQKAFAGSTQFIYPHNVVISNPGTTTIMTTGAGRYVAGKLTVKAGAGLVILNSSTTAVRKLDLENGLVMEGTTLIRGSKWSGILFNGVDPSVTESNLRLERNGTFDLVNGPFNNYLHRIILNGNVRLTLNDTLNISGGTTPGQNVGAIDGQDGTSQIVSNGLLVLRADANGAARYNSVASTANPAVVGEFAMEMYFPVPGNLSGRAFRLLSFPLAGSRLFGTSVAGLDYPANRVRDQDGSNSALPSQAHHNGFGTLVTPDSIRVNESGFPADFDGWPRLGSISTTSIRRYNPAPGGSGNFNSSPASHNILGLTNDQVLAEGGSYMMFIRGNRTVTAPGNSPALLRLYGTLRPSPLTASIPGTSTAKFAVFANPFAGVLNFETFRLANSTKFDSERFWWWWADGGGSGRWVLATREGTGWADDAGNGDDLKYLNPGQAVLLETTLPDPTTLDVNESMKGTFADLPLIRPFETNPTTVVPRMLLGWNYITSDDRKVNLDGTLISFDNSYSNDASDKLDIGKLWGFSSSIAMSTVINNKHYARQARSIPVNGDKIDIRLNRMEIGKHQFTVRPTGMESFAVEAYLLDKFLNTETPLSLSQPNTIDFTVTSDLASSSTTRFEIVFKEPATLPVNFTGINAQVVQGDVEVKWNTVTEKGLRHYEIQHSTNGREFGKAGIVIARNASPAAYSFTHQQPGNGVHYYRVRSEDLDGKNVVSQIVKVNIGNERPGFNVFPTVVTSENRVTLQLNGLNKGRYTVTLNDVNGRQVLNTAFDYNGGSAAQGINLPATLSKGSYFIRLSSADNQQFTERIIKH